MVNKTTLFGLIFLFSAVSVFAQGSVLLETIIVPNDKPGKIKSKTILQEGNIYIIEASGVISNWRNKVDGIDPAECVNENETLGSRN